MKDAIKNFINYTLPLFLLLLVGCATKPEVRTELVYKFIAVPVSLTERVVLKAPFTAEYYGSIQSWDVKEQLLFDTIQQRTGEVGVCNARLKGIDVWSLGQSKIYNGKLENNKE